MQGRVWSSFLSCLTPTGHHDDDSEAGGPAMTGLVAQTGGSAMMGLAAQTSPAPPPAADPEHEPKGPAERLVAKTEEVPPPLVTPYSSAGSKGGIGCPSNDEGAAADGAEQPTAAGGGLMMVAGTVARRERAADAAVSAGLSAAAYKPAKPANLLRLSNAARALVTAPRSLHDPVRVLTSYYPLCTGNPTTHAPHATSLPVHQALLKLSPHSGAEVCHNPSASVCHNPPLICHTCVRVQVMRM